MTLLTPELLSRFAEWRAKAAAGTLTQAEMKEAIIFMKAGRVSALTSSEQSRRKAARKEVKSADEMLNELEGLS